MRGEREREGVCACVYVCGKRDTRNPTPTPSFSPANAAHTHTHTHIPSRGHALSLMFPVRSRRRLPALRSRCITALSWRCTRASSSCRVIARICASSSPRSSSERRCDACACVVCVLCVCVRVPFHTHTHSPSHTPCPLPRHLPVSLHAPQHCRGVPMSASSSAPPSHSSITICANRKPNPKRQNRCAHARMRMRIAQTDACCCTEKNEAGSVQTVCSPVCGTTNPEV